jgi:glutamate dehydrogenase
VVLVDEVSFHLPEHRDLAIRNAVKAFSNSVLDLISTHELDRSRMVDYFKRPELIYLGPDEQIIPEDIVWIVKRAAERHYPIPSAFMSSKPDAGINHKVYGVTSEGVQVFLDQLLKYAGRNPRERPFTVKITGGPDGDVAGNAIKVGTTLLMTV